MAEPEKNPRGSKRPLVAPPLNIESCCDSYFAPIAEKNYICTIL